ncbi:MAG: peptidoglycan-binding protein [Clostridia bacterium]|nr:peptidoglycan-binding protein [Clostridia bacterium]
MKNKGLKYIRILALVLALAVLLPCMPALAESYSAAVMDKNGLKVYTDVGLKNQFGTLAYRSIVTVLGTNDSDVHKIKYQDMVLYCEADEGPRAIADFATPATVNQKTRVYEEADAESRSSAISKGTEVYVLATDSGWAMVEKDGNLGYIAEQHLTIAEDDPFAGGSSESSGSSAITGGDKVVIETIEAVVTDAKLTVYEKASTSSEKLGTLKQGKEVTIYAYNANWAYIGLNGDYGFCALNGLKKASGNSGDDPFAAKDSVPATVTADSVKVYQSASTSSKKLGTLKKGAEINLIQASGGWAYIEKDGSYGYCDSDAITANDLLLPEEEEDIESSEVIDGKSPKGTCTVITAQAGVYSSKSTSKQVGTLTMGDTLSFYGYDSKWVQVGMNGKLAYMQRSKLSADSYTELRNEDSGSAVSDLEKALLALGYLDSVPAVNFSASTVNALKRFQDACGMEQSGIADEATLRVLYSGNAPYSPILSASLSSGSKGSNVSRIQNRLHALGYLASAASSDGDYGSTTAAAVSLFQKTADIKQTGTADSATIRALYSASAPSLPSGSKAADAAAGSSNSSSIGSDLSSTVTEYVSGMSNAQKLEYVIYVAQQQLGKKYVFGATGTATFDCSGLTQYCFKQVGVTLKRTAYAEGYNEARTKISAKSSLRRGDLVFFNTISDGDLSDHTGIYLGSNQFIHASSGAGKVVISDMASGYYSRVFSWGRRVLDT